MCKLYRHTGYILFFTHRNSYYYRRVEQSQNVTIENLISTTVVFPDSDLPSPTNGGFENQQAFRDYIMEMQGSGQWNSALHARPLAERLADYQGDTIAQAFPLLFPYGHSGLPDDRAVVKMGKELHSYSRHIKRQRLDVLRKYLQHRQQNFHSPMYNLIVENLIMKETIFQSSKMFCNTKRADSTSMGEKYGAMTSEQLKSAISDAQNNSSRRHRSNPENRYLKSIHATCRNLPHSNEAAAEARKVYFSYCIRFGLPCIFLTISPDDQRNFRVVVYAIEGREYAFGQKNVADMEDSEVLADFKVRQKVRGDYPGLCAEEYGRIMDLVIKHLFGWDEANTKSEKIGLFGKVLAWCIATEEQGRKSLHGHILLFMKDWATVLDALHRRNNEDEVILSYTEAA